MNDCEGGDQGYGTGKVEVPMRLGLTANNSGLGVDCVNEAGLWDGVRIEKPRSY